MPSRTELHKMTHAQLVEFGSDFYEDEGHLRTELEALSKKDLLKMLFEDDADAPDPEPAPEMVPKRRPASKTDIGTFPYGASEA